MILLKRSRVSQFGNVKPVGSAMIMGANNDCLWLRPYTSITAELLTAVKKEFNPGACSDANGLFLMKKEVGMYCIAPGWSLHAHLDQQCQLATLQAFQLDHLQTSKFQFQL